MAAEVSRSCHPRRVENGGRCCDGSSDHCVETDRLKAGIRRAVAREHGIVPHDVCLVQAGALEKTSSGKLRRRAYRSAYLGDALPRWDDA